MKRCLQMYMLISILFGFLVVPGAAEIHLQVQPRFYAVTSSDSIQGGVTVVEPYFGLSFINWEENVTLENITMTLDAEQVRIYDTAAYATQNGTVVTWVYPENFTIAAYNYARVTLNTGIYEEQLIPVNINRTVNRTTFATDGDQLVTFTVEFESLEGTGIWSQINGRWNTSAATVSVVPGTFSTDLPISSLTESQSILTPLIYSTNFTTLELYRPYTISLVVHVDINESSGKSVRYAPSITVSLEDTWGSANKTGPGYSGSIPPDLIPPHLNAASASTSTMVDALWSYSCDVMWGGTINATRVTINPTPITANFTVNRTSGSSPLDVQFTDTSFGGPSEWSWEFGDGTTSSLQHPSHTYSDPFTEPARCMGYTVCGLRLYTVNLTAGNGLSDSTQSMTDLIKLSLVPPLPSQDAVSDPDCDDYFEDLNGNCRSDFADVVLFFDQMDWIAANEPLEAFDFNSNERIDFNDVVMLFGEI